MLVLVLARVLQGLGAGAIPAVAYTSVGRAYPSSVQPRVFAVFSTAWVIPGMAGPAAASAISHALDWRFVFWAIVPLIAVALVMTLPALRQADARAAAPTGPDVDGDRVRWAVVLAVGAGLVLAATTATSAPVAIAAGRGRRPGRGAGVPRPRARRAPRGSGPACPRPSPSGAW